MKHKKYYFMGLTIVFALLFLILLRDMFQRNKAPKIYEISFISRGKNSDSWESIKQGAEQASNDKHVDLTFINLSEENNLDEQIYFIEREYKNGADAIVLSAANSHELGERIGEIDIKIPIICVDTSINNYDYLSYISADDYGMGVLLGEEIINSGNVRKRLAIIESSMECDNIKNRLDGLKSVLEPYGGDYIYWELPKDSAKIQTYLSNKYDKNEADVIVALELNALEITAQTLIDNNLQKSIQLFGFGTTGKIASFMEKDIITATIVKNDFSIGYIGIESAVSVLNNNSVSKNIIVEHMLVNKENMFDKDKQRLLFPSIR